MKNAIVYHFEKPSIVNEVLYWGLNKKQNKEIKEKKFVTKVKIQEII